MSEHTDADCEHKNVTEELTRTTCDDCGAKVGGTSDAVLDKVKEDHDYLGDDEDDEGEGEDDDEPTVATDGGEDVTEHISDEEIEDAIESNDDPDHPDAWTVGEIRDLLAWIQQSAVDGWSIYMNHVEDGAAQVVYEDRQTVVFSTGEFNSVAEELEFYEGEYEVDGIAISIITQIHHELARERCDHNWGVEYPLAVAKPGDFDAGQGFVESIINGLTRKGLSPGQAWAYYGVEIRGNSRNKWAARCGYSDHSAVSGPLRKAKGKIRG